MPLVRPELANPGANRPHADYGENDQNSEHTGDGESDDAHLDQ
jgi:hypothetical protein